MTRLIDLSTLTEERGFTLVGEATMDHTGWSLASAGDVNGDGLDDFLIGAPLSDRNGSDSGAVYVIFGQSGPTVADIDLAALSPEAGFILTGATAGDQFGRSVAGLGDVNGDGFSDILIGAPYSFAPEPYSGAGYVIFGGPTLDTSGGLALQDLTGSNGFAIGGTLELDLGGFFVSGLGDVNGDGINDMLVCLPGRDGQEGDSGAVWVLFGGTGLGASGTLDLANLPEAAGFAVQGVTAYDRVGFSASAAGDVNGDGIDDIVIGAMGLDQYSTGGGEDMGGAYVIFGSADPAGSIADIDLASLDPSRGFALFGPTDYSDTGFSVSGLGDINGDGIDDFVIGAPMATGAMPWTGAAYVIYGRDTATAGAFSNIWLASLSASDGFAILGAANSDRVGYSVSAVGDLNGDGIADMLVGANGFDGATEDCGATFVIYGRNTAAGGSAFTTLDLSNLDPLDGFALTGAGLWDVAGSCVSAAGDLNGDGHADLLIGAPATDGGGTDSGAAWVIWGGQSASRMSGSAESDTLAGSGEADAVLGFAGDDVLDGEAGNDTIEGDGGDDWLDGGSGDDLMLGGSGNDYYSVDSATDCVCEATVFAPGIGTANASLDAGGADTIAASVTFSLDSSAGVRFVETLLLTGSDNIHGTGNALANVLIGNDGRNRLLGRGGNDTLEGGGGADTLLGGAGSDTYRLESSLDRVFETTTATSGIDAGGRDTVLAGFSFSLAASVGLSFVECLTLTGPGDLNGTGNALDNLITGTSGANRLDGGAGNDSMLGGAGDDLYIVDSATDRIYETTSQTSGLDAGGEDAVSASVTFSLDASAGVRFVERLTLTGSGAINATGNALGNTLTGNEGGNILAGGLGADTLTGGAGADIFLFNTAPGPGNADRITDFSALDDTIRLDDAVFTGLATGRLAASAFTTNLSGLASDADDRLIYETDTGRLWFDADGTGAGARVVVAYLAPGLSLTNADFSVI